MAIVDETYAVMLGAMALHFHASPGASLRRSRWMNAAIDLMTGVLRPLSILLMCLQSGVAGRTAGPGFELDAVPPLGRRRPDRRCHGPRQASLPRTMRTSWRPVSADWPAPAGSE